MPSRRAQVIAVPRDGCLILFNLTSHEAEAWRSTCSRYAKHLEMHVCDPQVAYAFWGGDWLHGSFHKPERRDYVIRWRMEASPC